MRLLRSAIIIMGIPSQPAAECHRILVSNRGPCPYQCGWERNTECTRVCTDVGAAPMARPREPSVGAASMSRASTTRRGRGAATYVRMELTLRHLPSAMMYSTDRPGPQGRGLVLRLSMRKLCAANSVCSAGARGAHGCEGRGNQLAELCIGHCCAAWRGKQR